MKWVLDTNLLVSGSLWRGNAARLIDFAMDGNAILCVSESILAELAEVLARGKFQNRLNLSGVTVREIVFHFREASLVIHPKEIEKPPLLRDPEDLHILACAIAAEADAIITGDLDLLTLRAFQGIPIITAREALMKIGLA